MSLQPSATAQSVPYVLPALHSDYSHESPNDNDATSPVIRSLLSSDQSVIQLQIPISFLEPPPIPLS